MNIFPDPEGYTPVIRQYLEERAKTDNALLLFRLGDFYECFFTDAEIIAKELEITLTARSGQAHPTGKVPMAGIPVKSAEAYINKLLKAGFKVAVCEQVGEQSGKGPMRREVVRVLTPGTIVEQEFLQGEAHCYIASIYPENQQWGLAFVDVSTAEINVCQLSADELILELERIKPSELLLPTTQIKDENGIEISKRLMPERFNTQEFFITERDASYCFKVEYIHKKFGELALEGFGCKDYPLAIKALGAVFEYLEFTNPGTLETFKQVKIHEQNLFLKIDAQSALNLEIFERSRDREKKGSLFWLIEQYISCKMGSRLLREWLSAPLLNINEIKQRQSAIQALMSSYVKISDLKRALSKVADLERLAVKLDATRINPRELGFLKNSLLALFPVMSFTHKLEEKLLHIQISEELMKKIYELQNALEEDLPITINEGGIFAKGYNQNLDELKDLIENNETWLQRYEAEQKEQTGIKSLKVCFNKTVGFYIEITKANKSLVPENYKIRQNLTNIDRYLTEELKEHERKYLLAESKLQEIEKNLFLYLRESCIGFVEEIKAIAHRVAQMDCLVALTQLAYLNNYICPEINQGNEINIQNGRHPVIERFAPNGHFIPNDIYLEAKGNNQVMILTGPNMSGKSTYMKQIALLCILAQIGSFVPAKACSIGLTDRIFTRIGASDDLSSGQSTFMVEMLETAYLLNNMTEKSLLLLDEVGRGTSTYDGVAIAWAVAEYIAQSGSRAIFATHYHELNALAETHQNITNYQMSVEEADGELIFLRKVLPGGANESYGIKVARMAGLPEAVLKRADSIMQKLHSKNMSRKRRELMSECIDQLNLF